MENLFTKNLQLKMFKIKGQRKAFYRQRIPESSCARKETVDIDILITTVSFLWNSLSTECLPLTYNLSGFKSRIKRHCYMYLQ